MWLLSTRPRLRTMMRPSTVRHRHAPVAPTTLVSPYGAEFLGFHIGPCCHPQVPPEVSLAILTECVPFHQDALLIGLNQGDGVGTTHCRSVDESLQSDLQDHFQSVSLQPVTPCAVRKKSADGQPGAGSALPDTAPRKPLALQTPFASMTLPTESLRAQSLDAVIFGSNVFALLLQHSPQHITACHRVLRPHGVLAIVGQRRLTVTGPADACGDWNDFVEYLVANSARDVSAQWMRESIQSAHADVYFPYPHVRRRTFSSSFRVTAQQLVDHVRSWEMYQSCARSSIQSDGDCPGVRRRRSESPSVDPLRALGSLLEKRFDTLEVTVDSFVITCDSRPVNSRRAEGEITPRTEHVQQIPSQSSPGCE